MPLIVLAIIGLLGGWCACTALLAKKRATIGGLKRLLVGLAILVAAIMVAVTFFETMRYEFAFDIEQSLIDNRFIFITFWILLGILSRMFQAKMLIIFSHLRDIALVDTKGSPNVGSKDFETKSFPWFVEFGLLISIIVVIVLAFNPSILKGLTSVKAGSLEADFSRSTVVTQKSQVSVLDANRLSTALNWARFDLNSDDAVRIVNYPNTDTTIARNKFTDALLTDELIPIFQFLTCAQIQNHLLNPKSSEILKKVAFDLSELIKIDMDPDRQDTSKDSGAISSIAEEINKFFGPDKPFINASSCEADIVTKPLRNFATPSYDAFKKVLSDNSNEIDKLAGSKESLWDPYVIEAAADLLGLMDDRRQEENFLVTTYDDLEKKNLLCAFPCKQIMPAQLSLKYAVLAAKIQSERPWQFEPMFHKVQEMLRDTDIAALSQTLPARQTYFLKNRIIDLSLGLQLFYQRALYSQRFTPVQMQAWKDWLSETRSVVDLLTGTGAYWPPTFDADRRRAWASAGDEIRADPTIIQDAATSAGMSFILLPVQTGSVSSSDCLAARSMLNYAFRENGDTFSQAMHFLPDDKATYLGLVEQMKMRIEEECAAL